MQLDDGLELVVRPVTPTHGEAVNPRRLGIYKHHLTHGTQERSGEREFVLPSAEDEACEGASSSEEAQAAPSVEDTEARPQQRGGKN